MIIIISLTLCLLEVYVLLTNINPIQKERNQIAKAIVYNFINGAEIFIGKIVPFMLQIGLLLMSSISICFCLLL